MADPVGTTLPWEFVQDDLDARRGVARVLDAENTLVCETTPENADLIVCAVVMHMMLRQFYLPAITEQMNQVAGVFTKGRATRLMERHTYSSPPPGD